MRRDGCGRARSIKRFVVVLAPCARDAYPLQSQRVSSKAGARGQSRARALTQLVGVRLCDAHDARKQVGLDAHGAAAGRVAAHGGRAGDCSCVRGGGTEGAGVGVFPLRASLPCVRSHTHMRGRPLDATTTVLTRTPHGRRASAPDAHRRGALGGQHRGDLVVLGRGGAGRDARGGGRRARALLGAVKVSRRARERLERWVRVS